MNLVKHFNMNSKTFNGFVFIVLVSFIKESIEQNCCYSLTGDNVRYCQDGTRLKGHYCGYGPCNIFGCNCEGGCRKFEPLKKSRADFYTIKGEKCISNCEYYNS